MVRVRLRVLIALVAFGCPSAAAAQPKQAFLRGLVDFVNAANGAYGDEGPALLAALDAMDSGVAQWDGAVARVESGFAASITGAPADRAARMRTALGSVYLDRGRLADAIDQFEAAAKLDPQFGDAHLLRAVALQAAGRHEDAAAAFRPAWERSGSNPATAYVLLVSAANTDAGALAALSTAVLGEPRPGTFAIPTVHLLDESSLNAPVFLGAHYAPAGALIAAGRYAEAIARLRALSATDGLVADAATKTEAAARLSAALRSNDGANAIAQGRTLVAQHPTSAEAHRLLGVALWVASRHADSLEALRNAVRLNPRDERSLLSIADVLFESRDAAGARMALEDATRALRDSGLALWKLATLHQALGEEEGALRSLQAAASRQILGGASHVYATVGRLHHRRVDLDAAEAAYRRRVTLAPNSREAHFDLGEVLRAQEKLDAALVEYLAAALLDPPSGAALAMAGLVHASAGRDNDAASILRKAVTVDPEHLEGRYALARALLRLGRAEEGQRELALFQKLQATAMADERRRYRENQLKIDAALGATEEKDRAR
jgi:tetratricopeptide (TPR) repeat protein